MALLNSGKDYAEKFMNLYNLNWKDVNGNIDTKTIEETKQNLGKAYDVLFEYLCEKLKTGTISTTTNISGAHTGGTYNGVVAGQVSVNIK